MKGFATVSLLVAGLAIGAPIEPEPAIPSSGTFLFDPAVFSYNWTRPSSNWTRHSSNSTTPITTQGVIPVTHVDCFGDNKMKVEEVTKAKDKVIAWGEHDHKINAFHMHYESEGNVAFFVCNCKSYWKDHTPRNELDDAQKIITEYCGEGYDGHVFSRKWDKDYGWEKMTTLRASLVGGRVWEVCERNCLVGPPI